MTEASKQTEPSNIAQQHIDSIPATPDVSVLLVSYEVRDELEQCLGSLFDLDHDATLEVVVVDNESSDGTLEMLAEKFPQVLAVDPGENLGFGRGMNRAAEHASGTHLLLLNPDTVVKPGMVDALLDATRRHPNAGLIGGRTLREDGSLEPSSAWAAPTLRSLLCFALGLTAAFPNVALANPEAMVGWKRDDEREVDVVTGCLVLVSRTVWGELDGFDDEFFMYAEDIDLAMRARDLGYRPMITPSAVVVHAVGASSSEPGGRRVLVLAGRMTLFAKHWPGVKFRLAQGLVLGGVAFRSLAAGAISRVMPNRGGGGWDEVWSRRSEWISGYPRA